MNPFGDSARSLIAAGLATGSLFVLAACGDDDSDGQAAAPEATSTFVDVADTDPVLIAADERYDAYVERNAGALVARTDRFVALVDSGEIEAAKALYPSARVHFERIEPVASAFGNLDPDIDGREGDIPAAEWGGYHRIEQALWVDRSTAGLKPITAELVEDVAELDRVARKEAFEGVDIAQGSVDLLGEVSASKITGEEERYSHTDLWDFDANVAGAEAGFEALKPAIEAEDPELVKRIEREFEDTDDLLDRYREGEGFVLYDELDKRDTRQLSQAIDALGESLSQVPSIIG